MSKSMTPSLIERLERVERLCSMIEALGYDAFKVSGVAEKQRTYDLRAIINAARASLTPDGVKLREALKAVAEIQERVAKGREALKELQQLLDGIYPIIRKELGRNASFGHAANTLLLRASGHFFQIGQRATELEKADGDELVKLREELAGIATELRAEAENLSPCGGYSGGESHPAPELREWANRIDAALNREEEG
jgi:hypothetical protein